MKKITLQSSDIRTQLNFLSGWRENLQFFQEEFIKKLYPIISDFTDYPLHIRQDGVFSLPIYDHFINDYHYKSALLEIMYFVRNENIWRHAHKFITQSLNHNKYIYENYYSNNILESNFLNNICQTFPVFFNEQLIKTYHNNELLIKHIQNSELNISKKINLSAKENIKKIQKIQNILSQKTLRNDILDIFLNAEAYHIEPIYKIFLYDLDNFFKSVDYDPKWRMYVCKYMLYWIYISIQESYDISKKILDIIDKNDDNIVFHLCYDEDCILRNFKIL